MIGQAEVNFRTKKFDTLPRRERYIFLIHGYHVSEAAARKMYGSFVADFGPDARSLKDDVVFLFWPGDETFRPLSGVCYLWKIPRARAVGRQFAAYLNTLRSPRNTPCEIVLIAHSLGCRLILMGAAVPVELVDSRGYLRPAIGDTAQAIVFFSESDEVLGSWKFRIAESSEGLLFPEAVGLHGHPRAAVWSEQKRAEGHRHRDYWRKGQIAPVIARLLGEVAALPLTSRQIGAGRSVARRPDPPARHDPPARAGSRL
jgi:hypothetical protein